MKYSSIHKRIMSAASALAVLALLGMGSSTAVAQTYDVTDLGVLPKKGVDGTVATAINDQGQVAGTSRDTAFKYHSSSRQLEDLTSKLPGATSRGFGINEAGLVVGDSTFPGNGVVIGGRQPVSRAALFKEGSATDLGTLKNGGSYSRANSINAAGQVVGFSGPQIDSTTSRAFIWSSVTGMMDLGTLGGAYAQAWGINDAGFVTGNAQTADKAGSSHAFLWQAGARMMRDLGTVAGDFSFGTFINANNHVVGYSTINKQNDRMHAFIFDGVKMRDLGSLGAGSVENDQSFALGVNAKDEVVGYSYLPSERVAGDGPIRQPRQVAFLYRDGVMSDLNSLIGDASKTYWLQSATAINNKGQITALAFDSSANAFRAVLLTPVNATAVGGEKTIDGSATGSVKITNASYSAVNRALVIEATYAESPNRGVPTLEAFYAFGRKIGTLDRMTDGTYAGKFVVATKPQEIEVVSSLGGSDRVVVKDSIGLTPSR
jgi:probable HAF family extracellular repeat protein